MYAFFFFFRLIVLNHTPMNMDGIAHEIHNSNWLTWSMIALIYLFHYATGIQFISVAALFAAANSIHDYHGYALDTWNAIIN